MAINKKSTTSRRRTKKNISTVAEEQMLVEASVDSDFEGLTTAKPAVDNQPESVDATYKAAKAKLFG